MTLSQWFRDYVYIPLGGNRRGKARQILNLCVVWLLTGLWHGSAWTFVAWGAWYAALLILEKLFLGRWLQKAPKILRHLYALLAILIGWIIFNSPSLGAAGKYLRALCFLGEGTGADAPFFLLTLRQYGLQLAAALALCTPIGKRLLEQLEGSTAGRWIKLLLLGAVFALSLLAMTGSTMQAFIYAQF